MRHEHMPRSFHTMIYQEIARNADPSHADHWVCPLRGGHKYRILTNLETAYEPACAAEPAAVPARVETDADSSVLNQSSKIQIRQEYQAGVGPTRRFYSLQKLALIIATASKLAIFQH